MSWQVARALAQRPALGGASERCPIAAEARDMKGAPLLTQHINAMDAQGTDVVAGLGSCVGLPSRVT